jgi:RNA polymerase sigma factor (sigma-70 family)
MTDATSPEPAFAVAVRRAQAGDVEGFSELVTGFQDMAMGYAYSILGDFHLAEDAAQEAFFDAYRHLDDLREAVAFPSWLRRIVFKHCDRGTRRKTPPLLSFEDLGYELASAGAASPADIAERNEMRDRLVGALASVPEKQRSVLVLHYMSGHSLAELAAFFDRPPGTIKKRLHDGRKRLREILLDGLTDGLRGRRPSRDSSFAEGVVQILLAARSGDAERVRDLLLRNPRLREGRDVMGNTALILAVNSGHAEVAALLRAGGAPVGFHDAAAIGDTERVAEVLSETPGILDTFSGDGFTAVGLAAHFGQLPALRLLLARGAEVNLVSRHPIGVTALHGALFGRQLEAAKLLIEAGADVRARRGGRGWPRAGYTPLHYAARYALVAVVPLLFERGADRDAKADDGSTPLDAARESGDGEALRLLDPEWDQEQNETRS